LKNRSEFIAVAAEYFFERPYDMKKKHPVLYHAMEKIFRQDLSAIAGVEAKSMFIH